MSRSVRKPSEQFKKWNRCGRVEQRTRVFLVGYFGFKNNGDDHLLRQAVTLLQSLNHHIHIHVLFGRARGCCQENREFFSLSFHYVERFISQWYTFQESFEIVADECGIEFAERWYVDMDQVSVKEIRWVFTIHATIKKF